MRWSQVPFESVFLVPPKNGLTRPSNVRGSGIPMINMGELFAHDRIGSIEMELVPVNERELDSMLVEKGDLLFARQSLVLSGAGKCSFVQAAEVPTTFESHIIRVRLNQVIANPLFFHYYFKSPACGMTSIVTQGVQAGIRGSDLKQLPVSLPPLDVQNRIAESIAQYDDLIENNRRRMALLEEAARQLYREWFVRLRFPGHEHTRITNGVLEGWERRKVEGLAELKGGKQLENDKISEEGSVPVFGGNGIQGYTTEKTHDGFVIAFGRVGANCGSVHWSYDGAWINNNASGVVPNEHPELFLHHLLNFDFTSLRKGAAQPFIPNGVLATVEFWRPSRTLADMFCETVRPFRLQQAILTRTNHKLRAARDLLLPRLMNGEITV